MKTAKEALTQIRTNLIAKGFDPDKVDKAMGEVTGDNKTAREAHNEMIESTLELMLDEPLPLPTD